MYLAGAMPSSIFILQLLVLLCSLTNLATQETIYDTYSCSTSGNYTSTSSFLPNLNKLLSTLPANTVKNDWFFNDTVGETPDRAYGLAMCHYDASNAESCMNCLTEVARSIILECPYSTTAVLWYDECFVRYSNQNFFSTPSVSVIKHYNNVNNVSDPETYKWVVGYLMNKLISYVASSSNLVAVGEANYTSNTILQTVYGLVECTRDLTTLECQKCIGLEVEESIPDHCFGTSGCRTFGSSCYVRYELYPFYKPISPPPSPPIPSPSNEAISSKAKNKTVTTSIAVACTIALLLMIIVAALLCIRRRPRAIGSITDKREPNFQQGGELVMFDFNTIQEATSNFSLKNKLGEGGFGQVFKGTLQNGRELAVKRLASTLVQGIVELKNEIELLVKLKHINLVQVLGYCIQEEEKLLCYEYLRNGSLDMILFSTDIMRRKVLGWDTRFNVIVGICRGLVYLQVESGETIIHRDLKASNILLDKNMNPKISDFGLARFIGEETHRSTVNFAGTFGYIAPEYLMHLTFSPKSDVFSFGVLILEIVTGRRCSTSLISYVWQHWTRKEVLELKDPALHETCLGQVAKCIHIGLLCVQEKTEHRPSISDVNIMLHNHPSSLPPLPPANFIWGAQISGDSSH